MHIGKHISGPGFWIETQLGLRQQEDLIAWLMERTTDPSGRLIRKGIIELFPDKRAPSRQACARWKKARWHVALHRHRLQVNAANAKMIVPYDIASIEEANRVTLQSLITENIQSLLEGQPDKNSLDQIKELTRCSNALSRSGREARESKSRLLDAKRKRMAEDEERATPKLTEEEKAAEMREIFGW